MMEKRVGESDRNAWTFLGKDGFPQPGCRAAYRHFPRVGMLGRIRKILLLIALTAPLQATATDWIPLGSVNYDNQLALSGTIGVAFRYDSEPGIQSFGYGDLSVGQNGNLVTLGLASDVEGFWGKFGGGYMQILRNGDKEEFAGFFFSEGVRDAYFTVRVGLVANTSNVEDIRGLIGLNLGI